MNIVKTPLLESRFKERGRPNKYPFQDLQPGLSLLIGIENDKDLQRVKSALYQYKKSNGLDWVTFIRVENKIIYVNRIS